MTVSENVVTTLDVAAIGSVLVLGLYLCCKWLKATQTPPPPAPPPVTTMFKACKGKCASSKCRVDRPHS